MRECRKSGRSEEDQIASILRHAIEAANAMIRAEEPVRTSAMLGMGTTLVAASMKGKTDGVWPM